MKLNDLKKAAARAQQELQLAEHKAASLQLVAKAAKTKSEQIRLAHKRARKFAKQAKKLAAAAEDQAREQGRVHEKIQKRLAKVLKKLGRGKGKGKSKRARPTAVARRPTHPKGAPTKRPAIVPKTKQSATDGRAASAVAGNATPPAVIPAA